MRTEHDVRRSLHAHAESAPEVDGVLEHARRRAGAIKRRRTGTTVAAAVVAVTAVLAAGALVRAPATPDPAGPTPSATGHRPSPRPGYRTLMQLTVDLDPASPYFKMTMSNTGVVQHIDVRSRFDGGADAWVFDPGVMDPHRFTSGQPTTVQGRAAYLVTDWIPPGIDPPSGGRSPFRTLAWEDPAGAWVVVSVIEGTDSPLERIAEAVRTGPPRPLVTQLAFGRLPAGLQPVGAHKREPGWASETDTDTIFAFDTKPRGADRWESIDDRSTDPLVVRMLDGEHADGGYGLPESAARTIAGHRTYYVTDFTGTHVSPPKGTALMTVGLEHCHLVIRTDPKVVPYEELVRMVETMTFGNCKDRATWMPPNLG